MKRILKFLVKWGSIALFAVYLVAGLTAAIHVGRLEKNRLDSVAALPGIIRDAVDDGHPEAVAQWISMRPAAETKAIIDIVTPNSGALEAGTFFALSIRTLRTGTREDALFWLQLARYRLRFDTLRCRAGAMPNAFDGLLAAMTPPAITTLLTDHPDLEKKSVQRVMDFDTKYPAANSPDQTCRILSHLSRSKPDPLPQSQWEDVRLLLRHMTESALKKMK